MKLALYQSLPTAGDTQQALARIARILNAAAAAGADMLVMPELYLPGYNQPDLHKALAQETGGPWDSRFADLCRAAGCGLTIGWAERDGGQIFNAASAFDASGGKLGHYRKQRLFGPMENAVFDSGRDVVTFEVLGYRVGLLICFDVEFADIVRAVSDQGVDLILVPTANPVGYDLVPDILVRARACDAQAVIAYANYCGSEAGLAFGGKSIIAGSDGNCLAMAGRGEALLVADLGPPGPR